MPTVPPYFGFSNRVAGAGVGVAGVGVAGVGTAGVGTAGVGVAGAGAALGPQEKRNSAITMKRLAAAQSILDFICHPPFRLCWFPVQALAMWPIFATLSSQFANNYDCY